MCGQFGPFYSESLRCHRIDSTAKCFRFLPVCVNGGGSYMFYSAVRCVIAVTVSSMISSRSDGRLVYK
jgi:hypothetical protein